MAFLQALTSFEQHLSRLTDDSHSELLTSWKKLKSFIEPAGGWSSFGPAKRAASPPFAASDDEPLQSGNSSASLRIEELPVSVLDQPVTPPLQQAVSKPVSPPQPAVKPAPPPHARSEHESEPERLAGTPSPPTPMGTNPAGLTLSPSSSSRMRSPNLSTKLSCDSDPQDPSPPIINPEPSLCVKEPSCNPVGNLKPAVSYSQDVEAFGPGCEKENTNMKTTPCFGDDGSALDGERREEGEEGGKNEKEKQGGDSGTELQGNEEYHKVVFFYHSTTGYYYDPITQQFFMLSAYSSNVDNSSNTNTNDNDNTATCSVAGHDTSSAAEAQEKQEETRQEGKKIQEVMAEPNSVMAVSSNSVMAEALKPTSSEANDAPSTHASNTAASSLQQAATHAAGAVSVDTIARAASSTEVGGAVGGGIADVLAQVSEQAVQKCGYTYDEDYEMYYDWQRGLYYDQESSLYYDAECGTYYSYDYEAKRYAVHSHVDLPPERPKRNQRGREGEGEGEGEDEVIDLCSITSSSSDEEIEEGELRHLRLPSGSPPPEEDWVPCVRLVALSSKALAPGTVYIVSSLEGAMLGREVAGDNDVKIPELQVSKVHAEIVYSRKRSAFAVRDKGSQNGTFVNGDRLSEPKQTSRHQPLRHLDTLTCGDTTSFSVHIHSGRETCRECDSALRDDQEEAGGRGERGGATGDSLQLQRRKELNRIKKRYGLRLKDIHSSEAIATKVTSKSYKDRAAKRRAEVGSEPPESHIRDDLPSSVHRPIASGNKGRRLLEGMGWREGEGLGKARAGRTEPVMAEVRDERSGLGAAYTKRSLDAAALDHTTTSSREKHRRMMKHYDTVVSQNSVKKRQL